MTLLVAVVDYGMGNIGSVCSALDFLGARHVVTRDGHVLARAGAIILPGVGAFGAACINLRRLGLEEALREEVLVAQKPFLGICLGMQLIAEDSLEQGCHQGFGWIGGHVLALPAGDGLRVPHVGWNQVSAAQGDPLFAGIPAGAHFYFDHGYHLACDNAVVAATCTYGGDFVAAVRAGNILAVQFHPEKSQRSGLKLLRNFMNLAASA